MKSQGKTKTSNLVRKEESLLVQMNTHETKTNNEGSTSLEILETVRKNNEANESKIILSMTIKEAIEEHLKKINNEHTLRAKKEDLSQFEKFLKNHDNKFTHVGMIGAGSKKQISELCEEFLNQCLVNNSAITVGRKKGSIRMFLKDLNESYPDVIKYVPELKNSKYTISRSKGTTEGLTKEEWWKLKSFLIKKPELYTMSVFALLAGGRRFSEVANVVWSDIDFQNNTISIVPLKKKNNIEPVLIPLSPALKKVLKEYKEYLGIKSKPRGKGDKLFKLLQPSVARSFKSLAKKAGIEKSISFHSLRASFITWSLENKDSMSEILNSSLHSSSSMIRYYDRTSNLEVSSIHNLNGVV